MNKKIIFGLYIMVLLLVPTAYAGVQVGYESASVGRIVGDSPSEMMDKLKGDDLNLKHATYYTDENTPIISDHVDEVESILDESFSGNTDINKGTRYLGFWDWDDVESSVNSWNKKDFFVIESAGKISGNVLKAESPNLIDGHLTPYNVNWNTFDQYNPLLLFNSEYAGIHLPDYDSFVSELGEDSTIVAPTAIPDKEFVKTFICNLGKYRDLGKTYRNARNNYYWQTNMPSGLALMSYELYGSPLNEIDVPDYDENSIKEYCEGFTNDYDALSEESNSRIYKSDSMMIQSNLYDIYTYEVDGEITSYSTFEQEEFSLLDIPGYEQNYLAEDLVLPKRVNQFSIPLKTVTVNLSIVEVSNPVELTIEDIPEWDDGLVDRICNVSYTYNPVTYSHSFTDSKEVILTQINPVEVLDCSSGRLRLYQKIKYKIDYLPNSPVLIDYVHYPDDMIPGQQGTIYVNLRNIKTEPAVGYLTLMLGNDVVAEKQVSLSAGERMFDVPFNAPLEEGLKTYTIGFKQDNEIKTQTDFRINVDMLETDLVIPKRVGSSTTVLLRLYNKLDNPMEIQISHYLKKDNEIIDSGSLPRTLTPGFNIVDITYNNLKKEDQSYEVVIDLLYKDRKEVLSGAIVMNRPPVLDYIQDIEVDEGKLVEINPDASDFDYDYLTYTISEPVGDDGVWYTDYNSAGNYTVIVAVSDGYLIDSQDVDIIVNNAEDSRRVVFRDCNYGTYRGGFAEISLDSDFDDYLESWYSNNQFEELGYAFGYKTNEGWPLGKCLHDTSLICVEDSDVLDPDWEVDNYPDPRFEHGGTCDTSYLPNTLYKGHEVCEGEVECEYPFCTFDYECGTNQWIGDYYCTNNSVYLDYRNHTCISAGTYYSNCTYDDNSVLMETCTSLQECYEGKCVDIECFNNSECGTEGYLGAYCTDTGIYNDYRTWTCNNEGTALASCSYEDRIDYVKSCTGDQICVYGECVDKNFYVLGTFTDGEEEKDLRYNVSGDYTFYITLPKHSEVRNATITVEGGR